MTENETNSRGNSVALPLEWHDGDMPFSPQFGDHFYCRTDGRAECGHVFLSGNSLPDRWKQGGEFVIGELGFGTGLNFCETWRQWRDLRSTGALPPHASLNFVSFELYPMDRMSIAKALSRWPVLERESGALTDVWPAEPKDIITLPLEPDVRLDVICGHALEKLTETDKLFDAWYLDGFAPSRNPAMWSQDLMQSLFNHTRQGGTFATYAAAGFVRRNLQASGFAVERKPGFAGKREMLCGRKA